MQITNLTSNVRFTLCREIATANSTVTVPLTITAVEDNAVIVTSSVDTDLMIRLSGIAGLAVGTTITVNINTRDVTVVEAVAPKATQTKTTPVSRGSVDRTHIFR